MKEARYAKLKDGSWGIRGQRLVRGETVQITTSKGEVKTEIVGHVLSGPFDDGNCLAKLMKDTDQPRQGEPSIAPCPTCGQARRSVAQAPVQRPRQGRWGGGAQGQAAPPQGAPDGGDSGDDIPL